MSLFNRTEEEMSNIIKRLEESDNERKAIDRRRLEFNLAILTKRFLDEGYSKDQVPEMLEKFLAYFGARCLMLDF